MIPTRSVEASVAQLGGGTEAERDAAAGALADALGSDLDAVRESAALALLSAMDRAEDASALHALAILQAAWWEIPDALATRAAESVYGLLEAAEGLPPEAVEDGALLLARAALENAGARGVIESGLAADVPAIRQASASAAGRLGEPAKPFITSVAALARDADPDVAAAAVEALATLVRFAPQTALPVLAREVATGEGAPRYSALAGIHGWLEDAQLSQTPLPVAPPAELPAALLAALGDGDAAVRLEAAGCLGLLPQPPEGTAGALAARLGDDSPEVAAVAAAALLRIGAETKAALALIEAQLGAGESEVWSAALTALDVLDAPTLQRASPALQAVSTRESDVGEAARELLARLG